MRPFFPPEISKIEGDKRAKADLDIRKKEV
jgi:hypothetical protein